MKYQELIRASAQMMTDLARDIGETIGLGVIHLGQKTPEIQVLNSITGTSDFCFSMKPGFYVCIHTSAPGKAILAAMPVALRESILDRMTFEGFTEDTITSRELFNQELQTVLRKGYAVDRGERIAGCNCVGVALRWRDTDEIASIWVTGMSNSLSENNFDKIALKLKAAVEKIYAQQTKKTEMNEQYISTIIAKSIETMEASLAENLDFKVCAQEFWVSYSWYRQAFKQITGLSPHQYFLKLKLTSAKKQLTESEIPINDLMQSLGFSDSSYFSAYFKRKEGLSPLAYRNRHAAKKFPC